MDSSHNYTKNRAKVLLFFEIHKFFMNYFCFFLKMRQKIHISASKYIQIIKKNAHALVYIIFLYYLCTGYEGEI